MLSLWLCRLSTDRIARSREPSAPLVVTGKRANIEVVTAVDEAAERLGLSPGIALAQAHAMSPSIETTAEDIEADVALLESIADWCLRYTPLVACDPSDGLLLDITGCAHLYGGETRLVADLSNRLDRAGFAYSLAIAGTIGIFLPAFLLVGLINPWVPKLRQSRWTSGFLDGVNAASLGLMAVVTWELGVAAIVDWLTLVLAILSVVAVVRFKVNSAWLVLAGGIVGFLARSL